MDCKSAKSHLLDYFFNDLNEGVMAETKDHLSHCGSCQTLYQKLSATLPAIKINAAISAPDFIETRILAKLDKNQYEPSFKRVYQYLFRPVLVLSLMVLGIWAGIKISDTFAENTADTNIVSTNSNQLAKQFANENYLTMPSDEYLEIYLNNKKP
jgi:hypothetical protein